MQAVQLGHHIQGGAAEAHCKASHRQYEMVVTIKKTKNASVTDVLIKVHEHC